MAQVTASQCITPIFSGHVYKSAQTVGRKGAGGQGGGEEEGRGGREWRGPRPPPWLLPFLIPKDETLVLVLLGSSARKF